MDTVAKSGGQSLRILAGVAVLLFAGCAGMAGTKNTQVTGSPAGNDRCFGLRHDHGW